ncbi:MAG: uncharacterized protein A8A55_1158 [Amphiamblys sp. WSBS2006]|nr:MAG: uncharacterized protein A8A55_1158 [Amphiamblys sp. WSBS2006]
MARMGNICLGPQKRSVYSPAKDVLVKTESLLKTMEKIANTEKTHENICGSIFFIREIHRIAFPSYRNKIHSIIYIERALHGLRKRLLQNKAGLCLQTQKKNFPRLLVVSSLLLASKLTDDFYTDNYTMAKKLKLPLNYLNKAESVFLTLIDYNLYIDNKAFAKTEKTLKR